MEEPFKLSDLDCFGVFKLNDVYGIESLVSHSPEHDCYLSRNHDYYEAKQVRFCNSKRKMLSRLLPLGGKKGFVVAENMANLSAKVFYTESTNGSEYGAELSRFCLDEDVGNLLRIINGENARQVHCELPINNKQVPKRPIEQDNKGIIKMVTEALPEHEHIVTPGLGGVFLGPFAKQLHGADYDLIDYSAHNKQDKRLAEDKLRLSQFMRPDIIKKLPDDIILFDDNVMSGGTIRRLTQLLRQEGLNVKNGATEFHWDLYSDTVNSNNTYNTTVFDPMDYDFTSPLTYTTISNKIASHFKKTTDMPYDVRFNPGNLRERLHQGTELMLKCGIDPNIKGRGLKDSSVDFNNRLKKEILMNS